MAYTINLTDGTQFATIADGTINTSAGFSSSAPLTLIGKNYAGYGEFLDENFIHLLENGASTTQPGAPLVGQIWWNKSTGTMAAWSGNAWKTLTGAKTSATAPTFAVQGDLWYDTVNAQLHVYSGTQWILVGPASSSGQGTSGAIVETLVDGSAGNHVVIRFYVNNVTVAIMSKDATFTPSPAITGFATIGPGFQLSTDVSNNLLRGTATNSQALGGVAANGFVSTTTNSTMTGTLGILNDSGLSVGGDSDARILVSGTTVIMRNQTEDGNLALQVNDGGSVTSVMTVNGATSAVTFPTSVSVNAGILNGAGNGVGNIGNATGYFNTIFAQATSAQYADVAERFASDEQLAPGTVVELGGPAEITKSRQDLSENVFGVVSTRAAYLMNSGAGTDATHPPVAMTGRVPVRTIGRVTKGDRLVSAGDGLARAALAGEATAFNVIGRALEDKVTADEGFVEAIVTIK